MWSAQPNWGLGASAYEQYRVALVKQAMCWGLVVFAAWAAAALLRWVVAVGKLAYAIACVGLGGWTVLWLVPGVSNGYFGLWKGLGLGKSIQELCIEWEPMTLLGG